MGNYRTPHNCSEEMKAGAVEDLHRRKLRDETLKKSDETGTKEQESSLNELTKKSTTMTKQKYLNKTEVEEKCSNQSLLVLESASSKTSGILRNSTITVMIVLVVIVGALAYGPVFKSSTVESVPDRWGHFNDSFQRMEKDFPTQYNFTWQILRRSLKKFFTDGTNSTQPNIIMMLGTANNRKFVKDLSDRVKMIVESFFDDKNCLGIKSDRLLKFNDSILKLEIEKNVTHTLGELKCHILVIEDIDRLREAGLNLLQAYCDHENSPYKTTTIILTATTRERPPTALPNNNYNVILKFQKMAREHLDDAWKNVSSDYREAWLSRFMQYLVVVRPSARSVVS